VQAVADRLAQPDFLAYNRVHGGDLSWSSESKPYLGSFSNLNYVLEQKDGSLQKFNVDLSDSVEGILKSLRRALHQSGLTLPLPPPPLPSARPSANKQDHVLVSPTTPTKTFIDHQYDIHSNHGRNLKAFLKTLDPTEVQQRKLHREDVVAVASVVRREFGFSAVDGTALGWSSQSLAMLLRSLLDLHAEHSPQFNVSSFYPLRLVWSSQDQPLDLTGGILYLNPAATPIQLLNSLCEVSPQALDQHRKHLEQLKRARRQLETAWANVHFQKGHSCSSYDFHEVLVDRLAPAFGLSFSTSNDTTAIGLPRVVVKVESPQACRRAMLTREGDIRIGAAMSIADIVVGLDHFVPQARNAQRHGQAWIDQSRRVQDELGVVKIRRLVTMQQGLDCLSRLLRQHPPRLAGHAVAVVASGHFCHLGDDGSLQIPHDWTWI
jgi:hypothetical protein